MVANKGYAFSTGFLHSNKKIRCVSALMTVVLLGGCLTTTQPPVKLKTQDEAGAVLLSVNTVAPWDEVKSTLAPGFKMDGETALSKVAPVTANALEQSLQSTGFTLGLGLPQSSTSSTTTTTNTGSTTSVTQSNQPGTAPTPPTGNPSGVQLPAGNLPSASIGLDPLLAYKAANSLNQYVQLLNTAIDHVAGSGNEEYVPYIVQTTLTFMPYRRDLPYDLHALISFFLADGPCTTDDEPEKTCVSTTNPRVIPILVTDDVEKALKTRVSETARQLSIAIGALSSGLAANAGYNNLAQALSTISAQDINSRLTVGRESENTLYARLGASYEATEKFALVGQTYDVYVLLLVPREAIGGNIRVISNTQFRHSVDGAELLPRTMPESLLSGADAMVKNIFALDDQILTKWNDKSTDKTAIIRTLVADIQSNKNYGKFVSDLCGDKSPFCTGGASDQIAVVYGRSIWTAFSRLLADSQFKSAIIELPKPKYYSIPTQTALIVDDKKSATITLGDIEGNPAGCISASLKMSKGHDERRLLARALSTDTALGTLSLTFDSPASLQMPIGVSNGAWMAELEIVKRTARVKNTNHSNTSNTDQTPKLTMTNISNLDQTPKYVKDNTSAKKLPPYFCDGDSLINGAADNSPAFKTIPAPAAVNNASSGPTIDTFVKSIVMQGKGAGSILVSVKLNGANKLNFTVKGAELLSVTDSAKNQIATSKNTFSVTKDGDVILQLGNLVNGAAVSIDATPDAAGPKAPPLAPPTPLSIIAIAG